MSTAREKRHMARAEDEQWRPAYGWEGLYEVSDLGRVRSLPRTGRTQFGERQYGGGIVRTLTASNGYLFVNLTCAGRRKQVHVHTLVLEAFVQPRPDGMQACHNDGDRKNPILSNLRWDTVKGNHADKKRHGTAQVGERNGLAKLTAAAVVSIRSGMRQRDAIAQFGVSKTTVRDARIGRTWRHIETEGK